MRVLTLSGLAAVAVIGACSGAGVESAGATSSTTGAGGAGGGVTAASSTGGPAGAGGGGGGGKQKDAGPDADDGKPSLVYPAPHPPFPRVQNAGGPVLASPKIYPVFFTNDDPSFVTPLEDFIATLGATAYWAAVTAEYGVGPATGETPILPNEAPQGTLDNSAIQTWLAEKFNGNDPAFPAPDADTLVIVFYPAAVTLTASMGAEVGCTSFGSFHDSVKLDASHGGLNLPYAAIQRCGHFFPHVTGVAETTVLASHELVELVTDPAPFADPAFATDDEAELYWSAVLGGGEVGDLCSAEDGALRAFPPSQYTVTQVWSNEAAALGGNPCRPKAAGQVYYNAGVVFPDQVELGGGVQTRGVKIPAGQSRTLEIDLFSDAPTGPLQVAANDLSPFAGGPKLLEFAFDRTSGVNGEKVHVTVTALQAFPTRTASFLIYAELNGTHYNVWPGLASN